MPGRVLALRPHPAEDHVREVDAEAEGVRAQEFGDQTAAVALRLGGVSPVRWADTLHVLHEELDSTAFLDIGPGATLAGLARRTLPEVPTHRFKAPAPQTV